MQGRRESLAGGLRENKSEIQIKKKGKREQGNCINGGDELENTQIRGVAD